MRSIQKILLVGRDVGPLAYLLKLIYPSVALGAVDLLGGNDTRNYADWAFSVVKQYDGLPISRPMHRSLPELLFELTRVMLEEHKDFDLLIPCSPFQNHSDYLNRLSPEIDVHMPCERVLELTRTKGHFIASILSFLPDSFPSDFQIQSSSKILDDPSPFFFIPQASNIMLSSQNQKEESLSLKKSKGFMIPEAKIHSTCFLVTQSTQTWFGLQTLAPPVNHSFFQTDLEKNTFVPFLNSSITNSQIFNYFSTIISTLDLTGLLTFYFVIKEDYIFPIACNVLPDENVVLWNNRFDPALLPMFCVKKDLGEYSESHRSSLFFNVPIYWSRSLRVPTFSTKDITQKTLPGVISHPQYPICVSSGDARLLADVQQKITIFKQRIFKVLEQAQVLGEI